MLYHTTWLIARLDPIKYIFEKPSLFGRIVKWKVWRVWSAITDFLAERANEEYEPMSFDFPNEDLMAVLQIDEEKTPKEDGWKMYFDGASNALERGVRAELISPKGNYYSFTTKLSFDCTNNVTKYEACVLGLQAAIEKKIKRLNVYSDSLWSYAS